MNRNPIKLPPADSELVRLVELMCDGVIAPAERDRLESLLENDRDAKLFYIAYLDLHAQMQWMMREECVDEEGAGVRGQGAEGVASGQWLVASEEESGIRGQGSDTANQKSEIRNQKSLAPNLPPPVSIVLDDSSLSAPLSSLPFYISHPFVFSNLFALLVIGIGALGAWFYQVDIPHPVAQSGGSSVTKNRLPEAEKIEFVGRVTGMVDVKWADINTSTETGNGVPLGRKYALSSGLMEITYHTGAKVILQGPATYEVDSRAGGFLSIGKLTARLEKKEVGISGPGSETANQKSSLSTIHYSLFTIKTPTATVTDLGTEFGVKVEKDQTTEVSVIRGAVETARIGPDGMLGEKRRVAAGEAVICKLQRAGIADATFHPESFLQSLPSPIEDSGEFTGLPLSKRWTFDTPNAGNRWSLAARPGFLRIKLYNAWQDAWEERGTAPVLYTNYPAAKVRFSIETYVDLATGNRGVPLEDTLGGLVIYDVARNNIALSLGLAHHEPSSLPLRDIAMESRGKVLVRMPVETDSAYLKLERDGSMWIAYYRVKPDDMWHLVDKVNESQFTDGPPVSSRIGLIAKSFNKTNPGGPGTNIDFDYFRIQSRTSKQPSIQ